MGTATGGMAQSLPQWNNFQQNAISINPAYTGIEAFSDVKMGARQQWTQFEGAPFTGMLQLNFRVPYQKKNKNYNAFISDTAVVTRILSDLKPNIHFGLGGFIIYDKVGAYDRINAQINYAVHFPISKKVMWAIAPSIGFNNMGFNPDKVFLLQPNDPLYAQYWGSGERHSFFDFSMGTVVYGKNWHIGYSIQQILQNRVSFGAQPTNAELNIHHNIMAAYNFHINHLWEMNQAIIVKMPLPNPIGFDINLRMRYKKFFSFGLAYRYNNSLALQLGLDIKKRFTIAYSYDFPYNATRFNNWGTHEFGLAFKITKSNNVARFLW